MTNEHFKMIVEGQLKLCENLLVVKGIEYSEPGKNTDDRLHAFKVAAALQNISPKEALAGMMAKHTVSIYDMCRNKDSENYTIEKWEEKISDHINYLLLLKALIIEEIEKIYCES